MKNRVKGAFLTLLMLFATLYPSCEVYANNAFIATKFSEGHLSLTDKQHLIIELTNDEDFKAFYKESIALVLIYQIQSLNNVKMSDEDIAKMDGIIKNILILKEKITSNHSKLENINEEDLNYIFSSVEVSLNDDLYLACLYTFVSAIGIAYYKPIATVVWTSACCAVLGAYTAYTATTPTPPVVNETFKELFKICLKAQFSRLKISVPTFEEVVDGGQTPMELFVGCMIAAGIFNNGLTDLLAKMYNYRNSTVEE